MEWENNGGGRHGCSSSSGWVDVLEEEKNGRVVGLVGGSGGGGEVVGMGGGGGGGGGAVVDGVMCMKVMTDEQMELLRKQICAYATICEQLVEMHKSITAQQDSLAGIRLGNLYCDTLLPSAHKITSRQRWTPTAMQLQILESIFDQGNGTPSKQRIKEITSELSKHGQISETNVYNWFQNRRARSKRKQTVPLPNNNAESEVETELDSPQEKKTKSVKVHSHENPPPRLDNISYQTPEISSEMHSTNLQSGRALGASSSNDDMKSSESMGQISSFYGSVSPNQRIDQLMGKMEMAGSFNFPRTEGYDMIG